MIAECRLMNSDLATRTKNEQKGCRVQDGSTQEGARMLMDCIFFTI